jgi:uncharacterized membrane protein
MKAVSATRKNGWLGPIFLGLAIAVLAHIGAIVAIPNAIMLIAMERIAGQAGGWNTLYHMARVDARNQRIVRSSPDLAYSTCALDVSKGPVRATIGKGGDYVSVALYGDNTDNVFSLNDRAMGEQGARLFITDGNSAVTPVAGETLVRLPSSKGLLLVRRLAPSLVAFKAADLVREKDVCGAG